MVVRAKLGWRSGEENVNSLILPVVHVFSSYWVPEVRKNKADIWNPSVDSLIGASRC